MLEPKVQRVVHQIIVVAILAQAHDRHIELDDGPSRRCRRHFVGFECLRGQGLFDFGEDGLVDSKRVAIGVLQARQVEHGRRVEEVRMRGAHLVDEFGLSRAKIEAEAVCLGHFGRVRVKAASFVRWQEEVFSAIFVGGVVERGRVADEVDLLLIGVELVEGRLR